MFRAAAGKRCAALANRKALLMKHTSFRWLTPLVAAGFLSVAPAVHAQDTPKPTDPAGPVPVAPVTAPAQTPQPAQPAQREPADAPFPKMKDGVIQPGFQQRHEAFLKRGKEGPIGVLFLGDSITAGWAGGGKEVWATHYDKYQPANFGIGGDRTQHVLWRIEQGELDGIKPKVLVLMIGTNNIPYSAEDILKGDLKIVSEIHRKLPDTKLLLLGIFPRGADPKEPGVANMRAKIKTVNDGLAKLDDGKMTRYLDITAKFLDADGNLTKEIMPDALHPNKKGYEIWAEAMQPLLDEMMK
jgi:lysophospholipase L1-like esterase